MENALKTCGKQIGGLTPTKKPVSLFGGGSRVPRREGGTVPPLVSDEKVNRRAAALYETDKRGESWKLLPLVGILWYF
ncbi:MAG: hypothetical protein FWB96_00870 [Defluviitaleaceae bacterium]|nr:hypothetical protein [Defluviitaleaceae bacterium]MCL2262760.1 hypothetical protein [Defluviitaleaceae bacterium]